MFYMPNSWVSIVCNKKKSKSILYYAGYLKLRKKQSAQNSGDKSEFISEL